MLLACAATGGSTDPEDLVCVSVADTALGSDERTPNGYTAADAGALVTPFDGPIRWTSHPESALHLLPVVDLGTARFVDYEVPDDTGTVVPDLGCADEVVMDGTLALRTDDGLLDEQWSVQFGSTNGTTTRVVLRVDPDDLGGAYVPDGGSDAWSLLVNPAWTTTAASGALILEPRDDPSVGYVTVAGW